MGKWIMRPAERALAAAGYPVLNLSYPSLKQPLDELVAGLAEQIAPFAARHAGPVHFVGHSLGGLIIRRMMVTHRPTNLGRVVTVGTPHHGSALSNFTRRIGLERALLGQMGDLLCVGRPAEVEALLGKVDYPLGSIAGNRPGWQAVFGFCFTETHDGKVTISSSKVAGMTGHIIVPFGHDQMVSKAEVHRQIIAFLREASFDDAGAGLE